MRRRSLAYPIEYMRRQRLVCHKIAVSLSAAKLDFGGEEHIGCYSVENYYRGVGVIKECLDGLLDVHNISRIQKTNTGAEM